MDAGVVRFYPQQDGAYGDIHNIVGYVYGIHIWASLFIPSLAYDLAMTMMHEGYHGYYSYSGAEDVPENFATSCVLH